MTESQRRAVLVSMAQAWHELQRLNTPAPELALRSHHRHGGLDRISNETIFVGGMVHFIEYFRTRRSIPAPRDLRAQFNPSDRHLPVGVLLHVADRLVLVLIEHKLLLTRNRQERKHVAARKRSDKRLLGINISGIAEISGRRRCRHCVAAVEAPAMVTRILLIRKFSAAAFPLYCRSVFGHAINIERAQARHNTSSIPQRFPPIPTI